MSLHFVLSIRLLDPAFHGRSDGGKPEWPPSPLRAFQALVAAAAARFRGHELPPAARAALRWLERQDAPTVIAPSGATSTGYRLSVPNNAMDVVARAWSRGNDSNTGDANPATHRTMKSVRPTLLQGADAIHYIWSPAEPVIEEVRDHIEVLSDFARSIVFLGWGVDLVVGHGAWFPLDQVEALSGERWLPVRAETGESLRVPSAGTLDALIERHGQFLERLGPDGFTAPAPLSCFAVSGYRRASDPVPRPIAAFSLLQLDAGGFRPFDTARSAVTVAGMMRHAARSAAERAGWPQARIDTFILGHGEPREATPHVPVGPGRYAYVPLPSIEARGTRAGHASSRSAGNDSGGYGQAEEAAIVGQVVGSVRRGLLTAFGEGCEEEIAWARRALSGQELFDEESHNPVALLALLPSDDRTVMRYTRAATTWATVTPMILPGYDDRAHLRRRLKSAEDEARQRQLLERLESRIDQLLRKAIVQAGYAPVLAAHAALEWRRVGFWPGTEPVDRYRVPGHLKQLPRLHVTIQWRDAQDRPVHIRGPICLGSGRFYGMGLFAALDR